MRSSLLSVAALCLWLAKASPIKERDTFGVTNETLASLDLFAQYSGAVECYLNAYGAAGTLITCASEAGDCPDVEAANTTLVSGFSTSDSTQGLVALDPTNELIVVAFQGSLDIKDILTDVAIVQTATTLCGAANTTDGCKVHGGFYGAMVEASAVLTPIVEAAVLENPTYKIVVTGHSLGGALAALFATELRNNGSIVDIYTYGQPHVGNADINNYIQSQAPALGNNFRVTHTNDVVPQIPPYAWGGWYHYYPEFWIDTDTLPVPASLIKNVTGSLYETGGNEGDNSGWGILIDLVQGIGAHNVYFVLQDSCTSTAPTS